MKRILKYCCASVITLVTRSEHTASADPFAKPPIVFDTQTTHFVAIQRYKMEGFPDIWLNGSYTLYKNVATDQLTFSITPSMMTTE